MRGIKNNHIQTKVGFRLFSSHWEEEVNMASGTGERDEMDRMGGERTAV